LAAARHSLAGFLNLQIEKGGWKKSDAGELSYASKSTVGNTSIVEQPEGLEL
jgi:hypothetical protein